VLGSFDPFSSLPVWVRVMLGLVVLGIAIGLVIYFPPAAVALVTGLVAVLVALLNGGGRPPVGPDPQIPPKSRKRRALKSHQ
jgi:hypothetical protein